MFVVLFEDSAALLGLAIAFLGIFLGQITGIEYFDGAASIAIGLILAGTAIWLAYETKSLLIGESADESIVNRIRGIAYGYDVVSHVNEILTLHMGPDFILVNISIDFKDSASAEAVERSIEKLDREIKNEIPRVKRIFIESETHKTSVPSRTDEFDSVDPRR